MNKYSQLYLFSGLPKGQKHRLYQPTKLNSKYKIIRPKIT